MLGGFSSSKLKPQLKMAVSRIQIASNKKAALLKQSRMEVAKMLKEQPPKEEKAKIRAEALIRDDQMIEAYEILQLHCEILHERIKLIDSSKTCPTDLVPVVSTLMWASHRVDIPELVEVRRQFRAKYGKTFEEAAMANAGGVLNERIVSKLSVEPPAAYLVQLYLERICEQEGVDWKPAYKLSADQMFQPMAPPVGYSVAVGQGTGLGEVATIQVVTGQTNADAEMNYMKQYGGLPPPVVTATAIPPYAPNHHVNNNQNNHHQGGGGGGGMMSQDFAEPDIFVPMAPSNDQASSSAQARPLNGHDDDDDHPGGAMNGGASNTAKGTPTSYENLAARFDQLKK